MNCQEVQDLLPLHVGDDLEVEESARVELHLRGCDGCSSRRDEVTRALRALDEGLHRPMPQEIRDGYWDELRVRLQDEGVFASPVARVRPSSLSRINRGLLAAAMAVAALLVAREAGWVAPSSGGESTVQQETAASDPAPAPEVDPPIATIPDPVEGVRPAAWSSDYELANGPAATRRQQGESYLEVWRRAPRRESTDYAIEKAVILSSRRGGVDF